jgi:hypothetical protein
MGEAALRRMGRSREGITPDSGLALFAKGTKGQKGYISFKAVIIVSSVVSPSRKG